MIARELMLVFALAVAVNYPWELAQTPFFARVGLPAALWHCFVASLGDGWLVLVIYVAVAAVMRSLHWYMHPSFASYLAMAAAGVAVAIAVEWWGLRVARRWDYSPLMPTLPWAGLGAVPILQMLVLPPAIFAAVRKILGWRAERSKESLQCASDRAT